MARLWSEVLAGSISLSNEAFQETPLEAVIDISKI